MTFVTERFNVRHETQDLIRAIRPQFGFNQFGEITYYRTYSRVMLDHEDNPIGQEHWHDTVIRVINGIMSIRKNHYVRNGIAWNEQHWQDVAASMGRSLTRMEWLPPGRGLWAMGTDLVYERGGMALYNCAFTHVGETWVDDLCWLMDSLMHGVGVGFRPVRTGLRIKEPTRTYDYQIPDSREGWVSALQQLLLGFVSGTAIPTYDYSIIRPEGTLIKSFGGLASGPAPLKAMLDKIGDLCYRYARTPDEYDEIQFKTDLANLIGVCVVTGNIRRSAEIGLCEMSDPVFGSLKDYGKYPERQAWGWMSNNSVLLESGDDFEQLGQLAQANRKGHDLGYLNLKSVRYGRVGKYNDADRYGIRQDLASGLNPCGEIPLEHREVCNLAETLPTRCVDEEAWLRACEHATLYCQTVSLLPTHQSSTNAIVARNRRIGISLIDVSGWREQVGLFALTRHLRSGYDCIRREASRLANEAGVPAPLRVTTVKPGGTVPKIAGRTASWSNPTFKYLIRRIRIQQNTPISTALKAANIPWEPDHYSNMTECFEYPIYQGEARPATEVGIWEQAAMLQLLQREWADNAVSNTLYFKPRWSAVAKGNANHDQDEDGNWIVYLPEEDELPLYVCVEEIYTQKAFDGEWEISASCRYKVIVDRETDDMTLYRYNPDHEEDEIEAVLATIAPVTKSVSLLPHSEVGAFKQMPEEGITKEEYEDRLAAISTIDFSSYSGTDGEDEQYCTGEICIVPTN